MPFQEYVICQAHWQSLFEKEIRKRLADAYVCEEQQVLWNSAPRRRSIKRGAAVAGMENEAQMKINESFLS